LRDVHLLLGNVYLDDGEGEPPHLGQRLDGLEVSALGAASMRRC